MRVDDRGAGAVAIHPVDGRIFALSDTASLRAAPTFKARSD
jgi:hypothetical protein